VLPGSSITGVCRAYAAIKQGKSGLLCAGKGNQENGEGEEHCGEDTCPVCCAFGFSKNKPKKSRQGLAQITTAHILLFPIATQYGPVWITSYRQLHEAGWEAAVPPPSPITSGYFVEASGTSANLPSPVKALSLGWLTLQRQVGSADVSSRLFPGIIKDGVEAKPDGVETQLTEIEKDFKKRLGPVVIVDNALFGTLVNDNMEVRTLVSIDPETGAAKDKALFTYEAIPRGALLWFEVIYTNPATYSIAKSDMDTDKMKVAVIAGFELMKFLGLGGMNTRGLGRVDIRSTKKEVK
jgi:CRISPR-associated protein Cmr4